MMDDQQAVIAFLSKPSSYGPASERVDIIETHVSLVFLVGEAAEAGTLACRSRPNAGDQRSEERRPADRAPGSLLTRWWREMDSNY
jgi:hypothetical protein